MSQNSIFYINTGDLTPSLQANLRNPDNSPVVLTAATVTFTMLQKGKVLINGKAAAIVNASAGLVRYDWQAGDTQVFGSCTAYFTVTSPTITRQTYPVGYQLNIVFSDPSQQFTTLDEVVAHLNATGPDSNNNFTVFGLTVSAASVQEQVNHANKYIGALIPSLQEGSGDQRLASAELAALDLACLGVLVTAVGGALVGAFDYFLGDMRVARAGPFASAIKISIDGYRISAMANLQNLSTPAFGVIVSG